MTIIPPSAVPPSATAPGAPTAPSGQSAAVLTQLPAAQAATPGTVITGTVVGRDNQGQMLLQTDAGMVAFKTAAALTVGSQVSLQIQAVGGQLQAVILSALAAGTKAPTAPTTGRSATAPGTTAAAPATTIATSVATGSVLTGTVIGPSGGPVPHQASSGNAPNPALQGALPAAGRATAGGASAVTNPGSPAASSPAGAASLPSSGSPAAPAALVAQQAATSSSAGVSTAAARYAATPGNAATGATPSQPLPTPATSGTTSSPATPAASAAPAGTPANPQALQPAAAGTAVQVRLASTLPGASTPTGSTPVAATLVAHMANGQTLIDTPIGRLTVTLPAGAGHRPPGSTIALEIVSVGGGTTAATALSLAGGGGKSLPTLGQDWPTLKAAISALTAIDPAFARQIVEVALPRLGAPRFLSQLLGQLVTGGGPANARTLLGDTAHALLERAGRGDVLARLDAELRDMNRLNNNPSDWRVIFLPLADMNELRQLRVYTRKKKGDKDKGKERSGRFIVEAEFEAYGPLQLDGLVQKPRIDLIVRSHVEFPPSMQAGIADVFGRTCDASGLIGKIFFHASPQFPVSPLDEIAQAGPGLSV